MKVALIGASGFVGSAVLNELLERGHQVTAIARHTENIKPGKPVITVSADVFQPAQLSRAVQGVDVVISAFNAGWTNPDLYSDFLKGSKAIQEAVKQAGVKRFIVVGGAGSLFIGPGQQIVDTEGFPAEWKPGALAARDYLNILKDETGLEWTFVSPAVEMHAGTSGKRTGMYRSGLDNPVFDDAKRSIISVEDLAVAITDEMETPKHIRQRFTVAY